MTGGTLLSRDNESIVLYRGKDFLPPAVSLAIEKRRKHDNSMINKPKPEIEESIPTQDASELEMANDASVHGHECHEEKHEGETSVTDYRTESLNTVAQNMETRLSQVFLFKFTCCCLFCNFDVLLLFLRSHHIIHINIFPGYSREKEG